MSRGLDAPLALPPTVCLRVTRACNAHCGFCLAPPDGQHPSTELLLRRADWLMERGVRTVHFCGGEPTIHRGLVALVRHVRARGRRAKLTTNAIVLEAELIDALRAGRAEVKVSLHGSAEQHDRTLGRDAHAATTANLRRLVEAGVPVSAQTTIVAGGAGAVADVAAACIALGVPRLSVLPFIPRGSGLARRAEFELSSAARGALRAEVRRMRRALAGRLDLRWLDFTARPFHVLEADGRLVLEGATEARDELLARVPDGAASAPLA